MAEGEPDRPDEGKVVKNGHISAQNAVENGVEDEPNFSDEEGFVDNVTDAGKSFGCVASTRGSMSTSCRQSYWETCS